LYLVNQPILDEWSGPGLPGKLPKGAAGLKTPKDHARLQVHRWVATAPDPRGHQDYVIGDWVIAERVDVRRGQPIGVDATAMPRVWVKVDDRFEVPRSLVKDAKNPKISVLKPGIKMDLLPEGADRTSAPLLVDFHGNQD